MSCSCSSGFPVRCVVSASRSSSLSSSATSENMSIGVSDCRIIRDELDSFVELVKLPETLSPLSKESVLEWFYMHRAYRDDRYDGMGCSGQFFTTRVRLFRRRGCWYAYHFVSVDM